jgi:RepB DNA-primase from phage plasmid
MGRHSGKAAVNSTPRFDEPAIRQHVEMIHRRAAGVDGKIIVCVFGEDPKRINPKTGKAGCPVHRQVMHFAVGDIEETVSAIMAYEVVEHANVYMPLHVVRRGLGGHQRGELKDIVAVLGLVVDADRDAGKACTTCPMRPSLVIETSPGNSQLFILFDSHVSTRDAAPIAKALCTATKTDSGTGDVAHVWRIPGTLNWPNAKKLERGRDPAPVEVKVIMPWDGSLHSFDDVKKAMSSWEAKPEDAHDSNRQSSNDPQEILQRLPLALQFALQAAPPAGSDRSRYAWGILCSLLRHGLTDAEIHAVTAAFPNNVFSRYHHEGKDLDAEIRRAKEKANDSANAASAYSLTRMNEEYAIVRDGGKTRVLYFDEQMLGHSRREVATFMSFADFRNYHGREYILGPKQKRTPLGNWWLRHPQARQYKGVVFDPNGASVVEGKLNLWKGFAIKPEAGNWTLMERHIREVVAAGDEASAEYVLNWITWTLQNPGEQAGVSVVRVFETASGLN